MDESRERNRILIREIRRGLTTWTEAIFVWARAEPDANRRELARTVGKALVLVTKAIAACNGDGIVIAGDSHTLPPPRRQPPPHFID